MNNKKPEDFEYISNNPDVIPDPEIEAAMEDEIAAAPRDADRLADRLHENTSANPVDAGNDPDADLTDLESVGSESFMGDNPSPEANDTEEMGMSAGVRYQDNEELDIIDKIERRDRDRFELDPRSKSEDNSI